MLAKLNYLPDDFLNLAARDLHKRFGGTTMIRIAGHRSPALFVSVLLHGNEDVGLLAVQAVLKKYRNRELPRELVILLGNTEAAEKNVRMLADKVDFNRVWPGTQLPACRESKLAKMIVECAKKIGIFANIDLHNNTGTNPLYSCISDTKPETIQLASLFSKTMVYFRIPHGVQSAAMAVLAPSITCECGKVGDQFGVDRAADLIEAALHIAELPNHFPTSTEYHLLHSIATIKMNPDATFGFGFQGVGRDVCFPANFDHLNFRPLEPGFEFARDRGQLSWPIYLLDEQGVDQTESYLKREGGALVLKRGVVPAMLTLDERIVRADCLGYFMEEYPLVSSSND